MQIVIYNASAVNEKRSTYLINALNQINRFDNKTVEINVFMSIL